MVERLLVLLAAMVGATLGMAVETGLDAKSNRSFTSVAPLRTSKWPQQVDLIPMVFLPAADTLEGRRSSYHLQIQKGSATSPEGLFLKSSHGAPPLGVSSGVLEPSCLQLLLCQNENQFYSNHIEIYHSDLPDRSAAACGHLCLRQRPDSQLVMAKLNPISKQLVCGCGDLEALPTHSVSGVPSGCSQPCPDGGGTCGGPTTVSVYKLDRDRKECVAPSYYYLECYNGEVGPAAFRLGPWERWAGGCRARCGSPPTSGALMQLTSAYDGTTLCECWLTKAEIGSSGVQGQGCGWRCPDGEGWCGAPGLTSVYSVARSDDSPSSAALREHPLPSRFLLHLLILLTLVLCFIHSDVLA